MSDAPLPALPGLTAWKSVTLPKPPSAITDAISGIAALGNSTVSVLGVVSEILDTLAGVSIDTDPAKAVLAAAIRVIETGLTTLLNDSGVYVLFVPVRRKIVVSPLIQEAIALTGVTPPEPSADLDLLVLQARLAANNAVVGQFFRNPADGGNAGFYRTVVESILDQGDPNRPLFDQANYVAGIHVLAGASDYVDLLSFITALDSLMLPPGPANNTLSTPGLPVPQDLKATGVRLADGTLGARLTWASQVPVVTVPSLDTACLITQIAIIRSTNPSVMSSATPEALFGTKVLSKGLTAPGDADTQVIDILDYGVPFPPTTYDDNTGLTDAKTYYYFASFRFKMGTLDQIASAATYPDQGFYHLSNVAIATATTRTPRSGKGVPPDWVRTPSVIDLIPAAGVLLDLLVATLNQFRAGVYGNSDALKKYVTFLQAEIERLKSLVQSLTGIVQRLSSLTSQTPRAGLYGRVFAGKGGTDYMLADLGASLAPTNSDTARPPFDRGDEFVSGVVVMVGGPTEDGVLAVKAMLETLFGVGGGTTTTSLQEAIASIDVQLRAQEAASFGDDFVSGGTPSASAALTAEPVCPPDTTPKPVFGENFEVLP
jgi:hypothetical protein